MVSEGVQTNGIKRTSDQQTSPPNMQTLNQQPAIRPHPQQTKQDKQQQKQLPLPPYHDPPPPPTSTQSPHRKKPEVKQKPTNLPPYLAAGQLPGYKLQVYHLDGNPQNGSNGSPIQGSPPQSSWYGTAPRSGKHHSHHNHHKHSHHSHHAKATRSHSSSNVLEEKANTSNDNSNAEKRSPPKPSLVSSTTSTRYNPFHLR